MSGTYFYESICDLYKIRSLGDGLTGGIGVERGSSTGCNSKSAGGSGLGKVLGQRSLAPLAG